VHGTPVSPQHPTRGGPGHSDLGGSGPCLHGLPDSISEQGWQRDYYIKIISASVSALRPRGMTLKGWPALGDVYCNVERRRSWTGFKLVRQRARAARPSHALPTQNLALSRPDTGRPGPLPTLRGGPGTQQDAPRGSRSGSLHLPLGSIHTPSYLALVSSERLCPRDRGTPTRAQHPYLWGARG
jgi:hypothetical protein